MTGPVTINGPGAGIDATTSHPTSKGMGGDVVIHAGDLRISNQADLTASTTGAGNAGQVELFAQTFTLEQGAGVRSSSTGGGNGSGVQVHVVGDALITSGASVTVASKTTAAGNLELDANAIRLTGVTLSAEAGANGGNIKLTAPSTVFVSHSTITAQSGGDGGHISIDPVLVVLQNSTINGISEGRPVAVTIQAQQFIESTDSQILTKNLSVPPVTDVAGTLLSLPTALFAANLTLKELCPRVLGNNDTSSFLIVGRNATPPAPGGLVPTFDLLDHQGTSGTGVHQP